MSSSRARCPTTKRNRNIRAVGKRPDRICGLFPSRSDRCSLQSPPYEGGAAQPRKPDRRSLKRRRAGVVAHNETFRREQPPQPHLTVQHPLLCKEGIFFIRIWIRRRTQTLLPNHPAGGAAVLQGDGLNFEPSGSSLN